MLKKRIEEELKSSFKNNEKEKLSVIKMIVAQIKNKEIEIRAKDKEITDEDILQILATMVKQRNESAKMYQDGGREDLANQELNEINIIQSFMPKQLSKEEILQIIKDIIDKENIAGIKDMGKIMKLLKDEYNGQMDFALASDLIKDILQ